MKKIRLLTLLLLCLLVGGTAYAQGRVSGVVKSSDDGQPLAGVVVQIKGTTIGSLTGADGTYTVINASVGNSTLVFTYAGMRKQEVAVSGKTTINVTLQPDALQANTVVVTAMGGRKQDRSIGYAITTVKGEDLARTNTISPANALQGKVAGVSISTGGSGGVTTSPSVQIRGAKSLNKNNSPIYVIDGIIMQYASEGSAHANSGDGLVYGNQLKNMNADDYENITVLKGAAATSLYGSRGANGAIVITTKRGTAGKGIGVEVNLTHEWGNTYENGTPLQNEFGMGWYKSKFEGDYNPEWNAGYSSYIGQSWGPSFESMKGINVTQFYKNSPKDNINPEDPEAFVAHPDSWKAFTQNTMYNSATIALTGGSEKATFRLSYGYLDSDGNLPNNGFDRHSLNFTANGTINDVFSTNLSLQYSNSNTQNAGETNAGSWSMAPGMIIGYYMNRNTDLQWYNENYIDRETWERHSAPKGFDQVNYQLNEQADENANRNEQTIIAQIGVTAQFNDWLDANVSVTYNNWQVFTENKNYGAGLDRGPRTGGEYSISGSSSGSYNGTASIHSSNMFVDDNLSLDVRLFGELYGNTIANSYSKSTRGGLFTPGVFMFTNSFEPLGLSNYGADYTPRTEMTLGVGAAASLGWKDQIYLEVTARNDWMSSLLYPTWMLPAGQDNYSVFYPSVNASWIFSDTFQIDSDILSYGQLRASFAQVGMGTGAWVTDDGAGGFTNGSLVGPDNTNIFKSDPNNGLLANYDLKPELQTSWEFGTDLRFLGGKIGLDLAYYRTITTNQILKVGAVVESGVSERWINAGQIRNQGWEVELDFVPIRNRTVTWNIAANIYRNRGFIDELIPGMDEYNITSGYDGSPGVYGFVGGGYGVVAVGNNHGSWGNHGSQAKYNNPDNPNDPLNGRQLIYISGNDGNENSNGAYTNNYYTPVTAGNMGSSYYGKEAAYWGGEENDHTSYGTVEADFAYGLNTSVRINLPNNSGSFDVFAQLDGRQGGTAVSLARRYTSNMGNTEESLYGRSAENGGVARVNYKGDVVYNGIVPDGVFWGGTAGSATDISAANSSYNTVKSFKTGEIVNLTGMTFVEAMNAGHIQPVLASHWNASNSAWGVGDSYISEQSYLALREITVGYNFPEKWIKTVGLQTARLSFTARNLCYIYNGARGGTNPDAFTSNNPLMPYDWGTTPFTRTFSFNLKLNF